MRILINASSFGNRPSGARSRFESFYPSEKAMEDDRRYFIKKMGWTEEKFQDYMSRPEKPHTNYPSEVQFYQRLLSFYRRMRFSAGRIRWNDE